MHFRVLCDGEAAFNLIFAAGAQHWDEPILHTETQNRVLLKLLELFVARGALRIVNQHACNFGLQQGELPQIELRVS